MHKPMSETPQAYAIRARAAYKVHAPWMSPQSEEHPTGSYAMLGEFLHNAAIEGA